MQGKTDVSTRIAGTIVMLGFVLIAQWHFFDNESVSATISRLLRMPSTRGASSSMSSLLSDITAARRSSQLIEVHQARSPTSWLRLQDHETAREVIHVIKPWAHSYTARVYDPQVFVLRGSDRTPSVAEPVLLPAVYDFVRHQSTPFLVTVLVIVAAVRILMNYLLWDETAEAKAGDSPDNDEPLLSVKTVGGAAHVLDVAMMAASADGQIVSVGLDRVIQMLDARSGTRSHRVADPQSPVRVEFPVWALAVSEDSEWLAILSPFSVLLWNLPARRWLGRESMPVDLCGQKPEAFLFTPQRKGAAPSLLVVRRNGTMAELWPNTRESADYPICKTPLICAVPLARSRKFQRKGTNVR